jgi:hypothetical protein
VHEIPHETTYRAVFQSVPTLTWAYTSGLKVDARKSTHFQFAAGRHASLLTLVVAHELGMPTSATVFGGAVASGRQLIVDYLYTRHHCPMAYDICFSPAKKGDVRMLKYLKQRGCELRASLAMRAAPAGHLDTMKYLYSEGCTWLHDTHVVGYAARSGNLEMVSERNVLNAFDIVWSTKTTAHLPCACEQVQWLLQNGIAPLNTDSMAGAARGGSLAVCEYLLSRQCPIDADVFMEAAASHYFHILEWLYEHECPMESGACTAAVYARHSDVLCWLYEYGCQGDADTCYAAACSHQLDTLRWLHERGCPWDAKACRGAGYNGALDTLRYLHENGCPWDAVAVCEAGALHGHLDVVRYVHEQGCTLAASVSKGAAGGGHLSTLRYLHEQGCPWSSDACAEAARGGHLKVLRYLHEQGCSWDAAACNEAAYSSQLETVRYLHEHGCPWDAVRACELAAASGSVDIIKYIVEQDSLVFTAAQLTKMLNATGPNDELEAAQWLRQQGAQWPAVLVYNNHHWEHSTTWAWHGETLEWARQQGCTSSTNYNVSRCLLLSKLPVYCISHCHYYMQHSTLTSLVHCCHS